ncbi:MAG TPA: CARDB domain-containing protein [Rhodanobacteraceae bacterium]|nr:CARDB domain-containing protein [Rhodanobacteraceae bacterium]
MSKRIAGLAATSLFVMAAAVGYWQYREATKPMFFRGENEEAESGRPPVDGDYWAIRVGYAGDPQHMRFEPRWLLDAKQQDLRVASGVPAGRKTYTRAPGSTLGLDPDAFTLLGPSPLAGEGFGNGTNAGRTNVLVSDPDDDTIAYLGSDGGGVWKTTNCCSENTTWTVKTDFPEVASMAIGDITIDPNHHNVVYAGTGDLRYGSFSFGSAGLLKSTDKGETWQILGEDVFNPYYGPSAGGFPQYQSIGKVVVDPNDSDNVIVGTKTGLFFSYDAGANWSGPCYTNTFSGGATPQRQDMTGLVAVNRSGSTVLYAAVGTRGLPTPVQPDLVNNGANGVYRAAMPASGCPNVADWTLLANGFPAGTGNGTPNTTRGRLEIAAAPSDSLTLYAMFAHVTTRGILGIWKSIDGGDSWTQVTTPSGAGSQMWYDAGITISPTDPNVLFISTVDLFRSLNGGTSWLNLTQAYNGGPVHPDNHARAIVGGDANRVINGCDGGVYYISDALTATSAFTADWVAMNDSLPTIEIYHGDITANFATSPTPGANAGFQDNGSATIVYSGAPGPGTWNSTYGGDGIVSRIEPILEQRWYYSSQNGDVVVSTNGPDGADTDASGGWGSDVLSFVFPFDIYRYGELDVAGSGCTSAQGCTHLVAGSNRLWETTTGGVNGSGWTAKTPNLTKNNLIVAGDNRSFINNLHYAVSDPTVAIVGTNDGNVQYVFGLGSGGAATPVDVTGGNAVLPNRPILDVATDPLNPLVGYAAVGGFTANSPATPGHVLQVTCTAQCASFSWVDKSGNLPDIPANAVIANPNIPSQVFVGMDWGLYYTDNINANPPVWQRFEGLPHVMVWSFTIDRGFTTLAAFTRSRGAWAWPLPQPSGDNADLAVTIDAPSGIEPGVELSYSVTVTNNGPAAASNVTLDSELPAGLTPKGNSGDCTTAYPCVFPTLAPGASATVTTTACVPQDYSVDPTDLVASATSDTADPNPSNNDALVSLALIVPIFADGFDCP